MSSINKRQFLTLMAATSVLFAAYPLISIAQPQGETKKVLIVYYSRTQNTQKIAQLIHQEIPSDIMQIEPEQPYPSDYDETVMQVRGENARNFSPALKNNIPNLAQYDTIIIGSPVWASQLSLPIKTFLKTHDLENKTILPFATYIVSSNGGQCRDEIIAMQPKAHVKNMLTILGENADHAQDAVSAWLKTNDLT